MIGRMPVRREIVERKSEVCVARGKSASVPDRHGRTDRQTRQTDRQKGRQKTDRRKTDRLKKYSHSGRGIYHTKAGGDCGWVGGGRGGAG